MYKTRTYFSNTNTLSSWVWLLRNLPILVCHVSRQFVLGNSIRKKSHHHYNYGSFLTLFFFGNQSLSNSSSHRDVMNVYVPSYYPKIDTITANYFATAIYQIVQLIALNCFDSIAVFNMRQNYTVCNHLRLLWIIIHAHLTFVFYYWYLCNLKCLLNVDYWCIA